MKTDRETQVLFAFSPAANQPDNIPVITLMMPQKAWDYMARDRTRGGLSHNFDLTNIGIPMKIIVGRCIDHKHGLSILEQANGGELKRFGYKDVTDLDLSFTDKKAEQ